MDTKIFTYFSAVEQQKNFSRAAQELYLSPQGLNAAMKRLEAELGAPLFEVQRGVVELTACGEFFSKHANVLNEQLITMREEINALAASQTQGIRLGCAMGVLGYLGEGVIEQFTDLHAGLNIEVEELPDFSCERNMVEGKYDFALITNPVNHESLTVIPLCEDFQFCWVNRDDPLSSQAELAISDLDGRTVMTVGEGYKGTSLFTSLCEAAGVSPDIRRSSEMMRIYEFVRTGGGIGLTCRNHVDHTPSSAVIGVPLKSLTWGYSLCYAKNRALSGMDKEFIAHLRACTRSHV